MDRVTFLIEDSGEQISCLLNPERVVLRRNTGLVRRRSLGPELDGASDDLVLLTGGGTTQIELDLLFDLPVDAGETAPGASDVRDLTRRLWELTESSESGARAATARLIWGRAWNIRVVVDALAERLEEFSADGAPHRSWLRARLLRVSEEPPRSMDELHEGPKAGFVESDLPFDLELELGADVAGAPDGFEGEGEQPPTSADALQEEAARASGLLELAGQLAAAGEDTALELEEETTGAGGAEPLDETEARDASDDLGTTGGEDTTSGADTAGGEDTTGGADTTGGEDTGAAAESSASDASETEATLTAPDGSAEREPAEPFDEALEELEPGSAAEAPEKPEGPPLDAPLAPETKEPDAEDADAEDADAEDADAEQPEAAAPEVAKPETRGRGAAAAVRRAPQRGISPVGAVPPGERPLEPAPAAVVAVAAVPSATPPPSVADASRELRFAAPALVAFCLTDVMGIALEQRARAAAVAPAASSSTSPPPPARPSAARAVTRSRAPAGTAKRGQGGLLAATSEVSYRLRKYADLLSQRAFESVQSASQSFQRALRVARRRGALSEAELELLQSQARSLQREGDAVAPARPAAAEVDPLSSLRARPALDFAARQRERGRQLAACLRQLDRLQHTLQIARSVLREDPILRLWRDAASVSPAGSGPSAELAPFRRLLALEPTLPHALRALLEQIVEPRGAAPEPPAVARARDWIRSDHQLRYQRSLRVLYGACLPDPERAPAARVDLVAYRRFGSAAEWRRLYRSRQGT